MSSFKVRRSGLLHWVAPSSGGREAEHMILEFRNVGKVVQEGDSGPLIVTALAMACFLFKTQTSFHR